MKDKWLKGTIFLTITALLTKLLSMAYKIPYQNIVGDEGLYVFQQVYPLVGIYMVLSSVVLPGIISELLLKFQYNERAKVQIQRILWTISIIVFVILFLGNDIIARVMGDRGLGDSIRWIGLLFLLLPHLSYVRGVHLTRPETMTRVGISITLEQFVRVAMIIFTILRFEHFNPYRIAELSYLFAMAGPLVSLLYLGFFKCQDNPKNFLQKKIRLGFYRKTIYLFLSAGILTIFQLIDSFVVFNSLLYSGMENLEAMQMKGVFDRGFPIIQSATFFIGAIVSATIPQLAKATEDQQRKNIFNYALFIVTLLSIPAAAGLFLVMGELNIALFSDNLGLQALQIMSLQVLFYPFIVLSAAVMQQEGRYSSMLVSILAGIFIKIMLTPYLTATLGIEGAAISSVAALGGMAAVYVIQFRKMILRNSYFNLFKIGFAVVVMWLVIDYLQPLLPQLLATDNERVFSAMGLALQVLAGMLAYGLVMLLFILTTKTAPKMSRRRKRRKKIGTKNIKTIQKGRTS